MHVPPTIALATRGRLQSLRLQLALLDREFDDLGDTLYSLRLIHILLLTLLQALHCS